MSTHRTLLFEYQRGLETVLMKPVSTLDLLPSRLHGVVLQAYATACVDRTVVFFKKAIFICLGVSFSRSWFIVRIRVRDKCNEK